MKYYKEFMAKLKETESCIKDLRELVYALQHENQVLREELGITEHEAELLTTPIENIGISTRAVNCLKSADVFYVKDLIEIPKSYIQKGKHPDIDRPGGYRHFHKMGPVVIQEVLNLLEELKKQGLDVKD